MECKSYKELQALAKLHGIRANLSKAALIDKLTSQDKPHEDTQGNAEKPQADSHTSNGIPGKLRDEADAPSNDSSAPGGKVDEPRLDDAGQPQEVEAVIPGVPAATVDADHSRADVDAALPDPVEPEVLGESSERRKSERLSAAKKEIPATLDQVEPEVPVESSERRKSDRLSAAKKVRIKSMKSEGE